MAEQVPLGLHSLSNDHSVTLDWLSDVFADDLKGREADLRQLSETQLLEEHISTSGERHYLLVAHARAVDAGDADNRRHTLRGLEHITQDLLLLERVIGERGIRAAVSLRSSMLTAPVTDGWQVRLPDGVRDALDVKPGERLGYVVDRGAMRIVNATAVERYGLGQWAGVFGVDFADTPEAKQGFDARFREHLRELLSRNRRSYENEDADRIVRLAGEIFGSVERAERWLDAPNRALGQRPSDLLGSEEGIRLVEEVLQRINHGING